MISTPALQAMVQQKLFANMPASVRQAYDDANADFRRRLSQAVKAAATPANETEAQEAQERAAVLLNLANAMKRSRESRSSKTVE
jgi:acyl-CoA reductase-like NAD-dependent aldehyde dehydrogenase